MTVSEKTLARFLLAVAFVQAWALAAVVMPFAWMDEIHRALGLGAMARTPVVEYLARSTSLFYALCAALLFVAARDVRRFAPIIAFLGWAATAWRIFSSCVL